MLGTKGQGGVVAGKSVSHHHRHSTSPRTELWRLYSDTGITEMGFAMVAYGDPGVTEIGCAIGSVYSRDPRVDRLSSDHIMYLAVSYIILSYNEL